MKSKSSIAELNQVVQSMVQGALSETTRQCGNPSCACAWDPSRRHGPHLYLKFSDAGKAQSVYVPPEHAEAFKDAQHAWVRFQQLGGEIGADNRTKLLAALERSKQQVRARRAKARRKAPPR